MKTTENLLHEAQRQADSAHAQNFEFAVVYMLEAIALSNMAVAQELKLANDVKLWELGVSDEKPSCRGR